MSATSEFASRTHQAVDRVASAAHQATDAMADRADRLTATPMRVRDTGLEYLRSNVLASVGVAFCLGWIMGRMGGR